ncbi:hypothetical protein AVO29_19765 [Yersinia pestis]|nr:hypothetical protein AVO29_19765 [Yersinia pestis]
MRFADMLLSIAEIQKKLMRWLYELVSQDIQLIFVPNLLVKALHILHLKTICIIIFIQKEVMNFRGGLLSR